MDTGLKISGAMHLALLLLMLLNGFFFRSHPAESIQVAEVSLISASEFDAAASAAPDVPRVETAELQQPAEAANDAATPEAEVAPDVPAAEVAPAPAEADVQPDVSGLQALEQPVVESPVQPDVTGEDAAPEGASLVAPVVEGSDAPSETVTPTPPVAEPAASDAPRIDTESAPEQPDDAATSDEAVEETVPEVAPEAVPDKPQPAEAPEEATVEVVPEPEEDVQSALAPVAASRPRGRPETLESDAIAAREAEERAAAEAAAELQAAAEDAAAADVAAAVAAAAEETATPVAPAETSMPAGPPMTAGEKDGLRLAVQKCWNVPAGLANASELVVVVGAELAQDGSIIGKPYPIEPSGELGEGFRQAFEAGRRALIRCAPYDLPADKYEQWRKLEVVFNPRNMVVR